MPELDDTDETVQLDSQPFLLDVSRTSVYALSRLGHVHHVDGSCFKNRYGARCEELDDVAE